jgi:hypothetical protein
VRAINTAPQGFKGPNYKNLRTFFLWKERLLLEDVLKPIRSSWGSTRVSIISMGGLIQGEAIDQCHCIVTKRSNVP